jgi:hypothetical protein
MGPPVTETPDKRSRLWRTVVWLKDIGGDDHDTGLRGA